MIYVLCDYGTFNMTTQSFNEELAARGYLDCTDGLGLPVYADFSPYAFTLAVGKTVLTG
jgi:hypothetical protein